MPSPFPGMDPFIEGPMWGDFHTTFNTVLREQLAAELRPLYSVVVERRVYVEQPRERDYDPQPRFPDVAIAASDTDRGRFLGTAGVAALEPLACEIAIAEEHRETYLEIRDSEHRRVVTLIETLSPSNKRDGGDGWHEYLKKRTEILRSPSHLVELDLLRGGTRMPIIPRPQKPNGDYRAVISRENKRPRLAVYAWPMMHRLPTIPIPLIGPEENVDLDLQRAFDTVYERAAYELSLDYQSELDPQLPDDVKAWLREQTTAQSD